MNEKNRIIWRRIRVYLVGLGIGTLLSIFFFRGRGCTNWTPSNRVHQLLIDNLLITNDSVLCKMKKNKISNEDIINLIQFGKIDFSKSVTSGQNKKYYLFGKTKNNKEFYANFLVGSVNNIQDTISYLIEVSGNLNHCEKGSNKIIYISPYMKKKIVNPDMNFELKNISSQQFEKLNISTDSLKLIISKGTLNTNLSEPDLKPNSIFVFQNTINSELYFFTFIKKERIIKVIDIKKS